MEMGQCIPLFDVLTGLDLNIKLQMTPSHDIPDEFTMDIADKLLTIVNRTMRNKISLEVRDVYIFYLPKSKRNPQIYYLFDIFLFNTTAEIKYSTAVMESKKFFEEIKQTIQMHNNLKTTGFKVEFSHRTKVMSHHTYIDTSVTSGGVLVPLMTEGLTTKLPRPSISISDINWCYRTSFQSSDEIEVVSKYVLRLTLIDLIVYKEHYDVTKTGDAVYVCLDFLVRQVNLKEKTPKTLNEGGIFGEEKDRESGTTISGWSKEIILTGSIFFAVLIGIFLYRARAAFVKYPPIT